MKIFNYKQLLIILKPKYNYPIICKLIIQQLRQQRFKNKQNKLLNNLLKYQVLDDKCSKNFELCFNRFTLSSYIDDIIDMYRNEYEQYCDKLTEYNKTIIKDSYTEFLKDNSKYKNFKIHTHYYRNGEKINECYESTTLFQMIYTLYDTYYDPQEQIDHCEFIK